jgi:hypothetical protein
MRVDLSVKVGDEWPDWYRGVLTRREGRCVSLALTEVQKHAWVSCQVTPPQTDVLLGGDSWSPHEDLQFYNLMFEGVTSSGGCQYASPDRQTTIVVFWRFT